MIRKFNQNGFVILQSINFKHIKNDLRKNIRITLEEILRKKKIKIRKVKSFDKFLTEIYKKDVSKNHKIFKSLYEIAPSLPSIFGLSTSKTFIKIAKQLGLKIPVVGTGSTLRIDRPNDINRITSIHQDQWYSFLSNNAITIWFNLSKIKNEDGPIKIYKKSHKYGIFKFKNINMGTYKASLKKRDKFEIEKIFLKENQILIFNQKLLHESSKNNSKNKPRLSAQIRFNDLKNLSDLTSSFKFVSSEFVQKKQNQNLLR